MERGEGELCEVGSKVVKGVSVIVDASAESVSLSLRHPVTVVVLSSMLVGCGKGMALGPW